MTCATALAVAGCGGGAAASSSVSSTTATTSSHTTTSRPSPPRRHRAAGAPIGRAQRVRAGAATLKVTVTRVIDPLRDTGSSLLPGTRAVGVQLTIATLAGATYDSTASGDVSVQVSSGSAAPLLIRSGVCQTPLTDFESLIGVGETHSGCVGFSVPRRARIVSVRFSPYSRPPGSVTWR